MKLNAVYFEILKFQESNLERLRREFALTVIASPRDLSEDDLKQASILFAPLGYMWDENIFVRCPNLKVVASNTTGHPHIDLVSAERRGIKVVTLKGETEFLNEITPTAEHSIGLMLALTRNLVPAVDAVRRGEWDRRPYGGDGMLSRMSLGVVGYGRLGKLVAKYGAAFGMRVSFYDPYVEQTCDWHEAKSEVLKISDLRKLVSENDIISVHVPHTPEAEKMFDRKLFSKFKPGSYFVNTARGELIDHLALLEVLESKHIAGAALDVFEDEFTPGFSLNDNKLWLYFCKNDNLIITPHIGGSTKDAWRLTEEFTINRVVDFLTKHK
jgi:phosphoglycerate dehydrogenase-like enzyme